MGAKLAFIEAAIRPGGTVAQACREHGISRQTGHKWLRRYRQEGYAGLEERSRRPRASDGTAEAMVQAILAVRRRHPTWGPRKVAGVLGRTHGADAPSESTVARMLRRYGQVNARRPPVRMWTTDERPQIEVQGCNDLWTIDFKGWWRAGDGERCEPLTIRDHYSRAVLATRLVESTRAGPVKAELTRLFRRHGVPRAILADNGTPWVNVRGRAGLTTLSAWMVALGIRFVRGRVGCPQDNGGHERMHRDLDELAKQPAATRRAQQRASDRWRLTFNHVRPHDALKGKTPAEVYKVREPRPMIEKVPVYPPSWSTRTVRGNGRIQFMGDTVFIGQALAGRIIGLHHVQGLRWRAHYFQVDLGLVEVAPIEPGDGVATPRVSGASTPRRRPPRRN